MKKINKTRIGRRIHLLFCSFLFAAWIGGTPILAVAVPIDKPLGILSLQEEIRGKVTDEANAPLPGVTVGIKGTNQAVSTDENGQFLLRIGPGEKTLTFSFIGFISQEVTVTNQRVLNVRLKEDALGLEEVVVTALGISRASKSLGYAAQEVKGEDLIQARTTNFVDDLAGKVAGVNVVSGPSGLGGSSRITIRGDKSLNIGANQPLFVVDGVPITNDVFGSSGSDFQEADYGNGAAVVNPDDIESLTVLKGANAAALYGSRAANGVIIITTKSGKGNKGMGISVNSSITAENPLVLPEFQNMYGQGVNGEFSFQDGAGGGLNDGVDESWGPLLDGRLIAQFDSPTSNGYRGGDINLVNDGVIGSAADLEMRGTITPTPWVAKPNNIKNFYETGITYINNVALAGSNDNGDFRVSYTNMDQKGIVPNTDQKRNTFAINGAYKLSDKLDVRASVSYIKTNSDNRPNLSYGTENIIYLLNGWLGRQIDVEQMKNFWMPGMENEQQFNYNYNYHDNPYFNLYANTNALNDTRVFGNITVNYRFNDWLKILGRVGTDYTNQLRDRRRAFSTQRFPYGSYREAKLMNEERNMDLLLSFDKPISSDFNLSLNAGANRRTNEGNLLDINAPQLIIPGIYSLANSRIALESEQSAINKEVNSIYGSGQLGYKDMLFLEVTARNDWSSSLTLPVGIPVEGQSSNSYFYPSVSFSAVLSEALKMPTWISYSKLRLGIAQVGNDTDPYSFAQPYNPQDPYGSYRAFSESGRLPNYNLKPEISTSYEVGTDLKFLENRIGLDFTFYSITTRNQILTNVPLSASTGYTSMVLNAGKIRNWGYEVMLNTVPIKSQSGFQWDLNINFSANRSKVLELAEGIDNYVMASKYVSIEARVGEQMGNMYGLAFKRVEDSSSPYYGQILFNNDGKPLPSDNIVKLGNYNPDWMAGVRNSFSWKGVNLSALFDIRMGGEIYSHTQTIGRETGALIETLEGRANGYDLSLAENGVIGQGVVEQADGSYVPNDVKLSSREWHTSYTLGRSLLEGAIFDASYVKLRELRVGYTLPRKMLGRLPFQDVNLSVIGRNLAVWSDVPHIDPETSSMNGGTIVPGVEAMALPSSKSWGINLSFKL